MPLTDSDKIEYVDLADKIKNKQPLSEQEKIRFVDLEDSNQNRPSLSEPTFLDKYGKYISTPLGIAGQIGGAALGALSASPIAAPIGGVGGYAGSQALYRGAKRLIEGQPVDLQREGKAVIGDIEAGAAGEALPIIGNYLKPITKPVVDILKPGAEKLLSEAYKNTRSENVSDMLKVLKKNPETFAYSPEQLKKVSSFEKMGLPKPSPAQMQDKILNEPTPAQYVEALLANKDPEIFAGLEKQQSAINKYLKNKYTSKGELNDERAGAKIGEILQTLKQKEGEKIGEIKNILQQKPISQQSLNTIQESISPYNSLKFDNPQMGYLKNEIIDRLPEAKSLRDIDDLKSKITGKIKEETIKNQGQGNNFINELSKTKKLLTDLIEARIPEGSRKPYQAYAQLKDLENTTLRGAIDSRQVSKVVDKIMYSGKDTDNFIKIANEFNSPELITTVKEQFLRNLFEDSNPARQWEKLSNDESVLKLLSKENRQEITDAIDYLNIIKTTRPRTINPSGSTLTLEKVAKNPKTSIKSSITDTLIGKILGTERKEKEAVKLYKNIVEKSYKQEPLNNSPIRDYLLPKTKYIPPTIRSLTRDDENE